MSHLNQIRPTEIAEALNISRPDLEIHFGTTGGNVMCIVAEDPKTPDHQITIGTAGDSLGWSDYFGERYGEWAGLIDNTEDDLAWYANDPLEDGAIIIARIATMLMKELPPKEDPTS